MLDVRFDVSDVVLEFDLSQGQTNDIIANVVNELTTLIHHNWITMANKELHQTRDQYLLGLHIVNKNSAEKWIVLSGTFPNMIENGCSAFDIKQGMAKSKKIKISKDGTWYIRVPFRWGTPGAQGQSEAFAGILPQEIYDLLIDKEGAKTAPFSGKTNKWDSLSKADLPTEFQMLSKRAPVTIKNRNVDEYVHKNSIFEGVSKQSKEYVQTTQGSYISFRTISENSDPKSWIHRGIQAHNLAQKAIEATPIRTVTDNSIDKSLSDLGF